LLTQLTKSFITERRQVTKCIDSKTAVDCSISTLRSKVSVKAAAVTSKYRSFFQMHVTALLKWVRFPLHAEKLPAVTTFVSIVKTMQRG